MSGATRRTPVAPAVTGRPRGDARSRRARQDPDEASGHRSRRGRPNRWDRLERAREQVLPFLGTLDDSGMKQHHEQSTSSSDARDGIAAVRPRSRSSGIGGWRGWWALGRSSTTVASMDFSALFSDRGDWRPGALLVVVERALFLSWVDDGRRASRCPGGSLGCALSDAMPVTRSTVSSSRAVSSQRDSPESTK